MLESATDTHNPEDTSVKLSALVSHYSPGEERPLSSYAILPGTYGAGLAGSLIALRSRSFGTACPGVDDWQQTRRR
jgi:hypothetical protein